MNIPIIRLEIEHMRETLCVALAEHRFMMDNYIKEAVDAYCTPENISRVVKESALKQLDIAIREEVEKFFRYGNGRKAVSEAVEAALTKE